MSGQGIAQILVYAVVLTGLAYPLGIYMTHVYADGFGGRVLGSIEASDNAGAFDKGVQRILGSS